MDRLSAIPVSTFVGRVTELARLAAMLDGAAAGRGSVALLVGEPGIGKTSLAENLAGSARERGVRVLWGRCYEGEGAPAFWPWLQILRTLVRGITPRMLQAEPSGSATDVVTLAPELRGLLADVPEPAVVQSAEARFRLFDSITTFLKAEAASAPLLVLLDDLHWADTPSLLLLEFLAREIADAPILVVGAYRDTEVRGGHPLTRTLGELLRRPHVSHAALGGLSGTEVAQLIQAVAGAQSAGNLTTAIMHRTEGNPLFITETLRLLAAEGWLEARGSAARSARGIPQTVRAVISRRLDGLSEACNAALTIASVVGREFTAAVLVQAGETAGDALSDALEEAEAARIVEPITAPGGYRFSHALIQETIYDSLAASRRLRLHRRVGEALEALYGEGFDPPLAELAYHFTQAAPGGDAARAAAFARRAADRALTLLAYEEAARLYQLGLQALDLVPQSDAIERCELLLALGTVLTNAGDTTAGQETFWRAVEVARVFRRQGRTADAAPVLARAALGIGGVTLPAQAVAQPLVELLTEALEALGEDDSPLRAQVLARLATDLRDPRNMPRRDALSAEAVAVARRTGDPRSLAVALLGRHNVLRGTTRLDEQLAIASEALEQAQAVGDMDLAMWAYRVRVVDEMEMGDVAAFERDHAAYAHLAERLREPYHLWQNVVWQAMRTLLDGRFAEAEELAEQALVIGLRGSADLARLSHALQLVAIRTEYGSPDEALARVALVLEQYPLLQGVTAALLPLYLAAGRREEAQREYDRLIAAAPAGDVTRLPRRGIWLAVVPHLAGACVALRDSARAAQLYAMLLPDAERNAMASPGIACYGPVSHYLGLLAASLARLQDAARHFEDALVAESRMGARAWLARTRYDYAAMLFERMKDEGGRMKEDEERALELMDGARSTASELSMTRLADQVERLQLEMTPVDNAASSFILHPSSYPDGLTVREVEVLRLLATGKTNAEIATQLVLSPSTVKRHAENIYTKIGARRRSDATAYALRHGLTEP